MERLFNYYMEQLKEFYELGIKLHGDKLIIVDDFGMIRVQVEINPKESLSVYINKGWEETETEDGKEPVLEFPFSSDEPELHEGALDNANVQIIKDNETIALIELQQSIWHEWEVKE